MAPPTTSGVRHRSPIHYGGLWLKIVQEPEPQLTGHYWTDRKTAGEIELSQRQKQRFQAFSAAKRHYDHLPATT